MSNHEAWVESAESLGMTTVTAALDKFLKDRGVSEETRDAITNTVSMMYEYIPYALAQGKNPTDRKVLADFLKSKGKHLARYLGNDSVNCGLAILDLIDSVKTASATSAGVPLAVLTWGLAMLDLIEVGNSCEPAQRLYYDLFLKEKRKVLLFEGLPEWQCRPNKWEKFTRQRSSRR